MPDYNLITRDQIIAAMASTRTARRRRRALKSEWLVEHANLRYPANKVFQRAAYLAGLTLKPKSTHQVADFLIKRGFTVLYNGNPVTSAKDAMRRFGKNATAAPPPYTPPSSGYNRPYTPPPPTQPAPMKVAPPTTRTATLTDALAGLELAMKSKLAERGITDADRRTYDLYKSLKETYLIRVEQGFKNIEERTEAETVLRTALIALVKLAI